MTATNVQMAHDGLPMDDSANAERLVKVAADRLLYVAPWRKFLVWRRTGVWTVDDGDALSTELAKQVGIAFRAGLPQVGADGWKSEHAWSRYCHQRSGLSGMLHTVRGVAGVLFDHELLDSDPELLNVANGTVDLRTGELYTHDRFDYLTQQSPVEYDEAATCPTWLECLKTWQPDPAVRRYLQVRAGACATGVATESLDIDWGGGGNGKGVFHGTVQAVLGEYCVVPHKSLLMASKHEGHPTNIAALFRKRCAVTGETKAGDSLDEEHVKSLTGRDRLTGRRMREDFWDFEPTHTLILHTNYRPKIRGTDEAIWRRVRLVPWTVTIPKKDRDPNLPTRLEDEAAGILRWIVEGAQEFLKAGEVEVPEAVRIASEDYREDEDRVGQYLSDCFEFTGNPDDYVTAVRLRELEEPWRDEHGLRYDFDPKAVAGALQQRGATSDGQRVRVLVQKFQHLPAETVRTVVWRGLYEVEPEDA